MTGFEQRLRARALAAGFGRGDRIVVGFSGGRDSLALAASLQRVAESIAVEPMLIHVDHRLRPTSHVEAERAEALAHALGAECHVAPLTSSPRGLHPGAGVEEAARRERYRVLLTFAMENAATAVATAHHQRDQAETVLLHLLRGGGVHGAAAMGERAPWPFPAPTATHDISQKRLPVWLWRPLLQEPRQAIEAYVATLGLEPVEDPSNEDVAVRRNALRHNVLPLLERLAPGATAALARYASLAAEDDIVLDGIAASLVANAAQPDGSIAVATLRDEPAALQRRAIRLWLREATGLSEFSANRTDAVLDLIIANRGNRAVEIGEGWTVGRERGMLHATKGGGGTARGGEA